MIYDVPRLSYSCYILYLYLYKILIASCWLRWQTMCLPADRVPIEQMIIQLISFGGRTSQTKLWPMTGGQTRACTQIQYQKYFQQIGLEISSEIQELWKLPKKTKNFQKFSRIFRDSSDLWETTISRTFFLHKKSTYRISWGRSKMHSCNISTLKYIFTWKQHSVKFTLDGLKCPIILLFCKTLGSFRKESFRFQHKNKMDNNSWRFTALQMSLSFGIPDCFWLALSRCSLNVFVAFCCDSFTICYV